MIKIREKGYQNQHHKIKGSAHGGHVSALGS